MEIMHSNDADFAKLLQEHEYLIVKYHTDEDCPLCRELLPIYEKLSADTKYADVAFVRMDSDNNPVARKLIDNRKLPFAAVYKNGLLIECRSVASEKDLRELLDVLPGANLNL